MKRKIIVLVLLTVVLIFGLPLEISNRIVKAENQFGFIIIVSDKNLKDAVQDFIEFKKNQGFEVELEEVTEIEKKYVGRDMVEKIRSFLKEKTTSYVKCFTLLVGDPYNEKKANVLNTGGKIPMRYIYPPPYYSTSPKDYKFPTDFYYCDLEGNWNSDGDDRYGEKEEIKDISLNLNNVRNFVGRIPFDDPQIVKKICANIVSVEKKENTNQVLMGIMQFANPDLKEWDLAKWAEEVKNDMVDYGLKVITLYEKEGSSPSAFTPTAPLNEKNFLKYFERTNDLIVTVADNGVFREIWNDNGDNVFDKKERKLIEFFTLNDLQAAKGFTKVWFDFGSVNIFRTWESYYSNPKLWFVTADEILKAGKAAAIIGATDDPVWPSYFEELKTFYSTLFIKKETVGDWFNYRGDSNIYNLILNVAGDPSFTFYPEIYFDKNPPTIEIVSPLDNSYTNNSEITVIAKVTDKESGIEKVEINSQKADIEGGYYKAKVNLNEGENFVTVKAIDKAGNQDKKVIKLICDTQPPYLEIKSPLPNSFTNKTETEIWGTVKDETGVEELKIQGERVEILPDGSFTQKIGLSEGENIIKLIAVDKAGNQKEEVLTLYVDTSPPEIFVSLPKEVYDELLNITGYVKDEGLSGIKDFSILINGEKIELTRSLSFTYGLKLKVGENEIKFEVEDNAGNKTSNVRYVRYVPKTILRLQIGSKIIYVNDSPQEIDVPPQIVEGRTLLPIRWVAEPLGAIVLWDATEKKVTITLKDTIIELWIGKNIARVKGVDTPIDPNNPKVVPMIIQGRTMLPVRFVAENLGCKVDWDPNTKTVTITYPKD